MEKIDFKKVYKDYYMPKKTPSIIELPSFHYIAIEGKGNPNEEDGEYAKALEILYALVYTIKMSKMGSTSLDGYYEYVMPPLEGLWWTENNNEIKFSDKSKFHFVSMVAQPDFVNEEVFKWACEEVNKKKGVDTSKANFIALEEGICVTCMHVGAYDEEDITIEKMQQYAKEHGYELDVSEKRKHHEIYLSDPRKAKVENLKTVLRLPVKKL